MVSGVKAGERIGLIGHSGIARDDGLHFEVRHNRVALDPEKILPARSDDQVKSRIKP